MDNQHSNMIQGRPLRKHLKLAIVFVVVAMTGLIIWQPTIFATRTPKSCSLPTWMIQAPAADADLSGPWWQLPGGLEILWQIHIDISSREGLPFPAYLRCSGQISTYSVVGLVPLNQMGLDEDTINEIASNYTLSGVVVDESCEAFADDNAQDLSSDYPGLVLTRLPFSVADNGKRLCFKLTYAGQRDLYVASEVINITAPRLGQIKQRGDILTVDLDPRTLADNIWRWMFVGYAPVTDSNLGYCNKDGFEHLNSQLAEAKQLRRTFNGEMARNVYNPVSIPLTEADIGRRYCLELRTSRFENTYRDNEYYIYTYYKLSPAIISNQGFDPPPVPLDQRFTPNDLRAYFRQSLTAKGQQRLDALTLKINNTGCQDYTYTSGAKGCYIGGDNNESEDTIYLHNSLFPVGYVNLPPADKKKTVKKAIRILAHEFWHAVEDGAIEWILFDCHRRWFELTNIELQHYVHSPPEADFDTWISKENIVFFWSGEKRSFVQSCIYKNSQYGSVLQSLVDTEATLPSKKYVIRRNAENLFINHVMGLSYPNQFLPENQPLSDHVKIFNLNQLTGWYGEYHAELPLIVLDLSPTLESYYSQYFRDRAHFVEILHTPGEMW